MKRRARPIGDFSRVAICHKLYYPDAMLKRFFATNNQAVIATTICAFAYLYGFPYQSKINNPNENVRFYMTASIVEEGTYAIDTMRARWGWVNDAAVHDNHVYSVKAPGTSFLGVPGYAAYRFITELGGLSYDRTIALWVCRFTASILPTLIFLFFFYGWISRQTRYPLLRNTVFLSLAIGSLFYGYALLFVSHTLSAVAGFGAFMILYDYRRNQPNSVSHVKTFLAGLLTAGATFFEYPGLIASLILSIFALLVLRPLSRLCSFAVGGLLPTLLMMHFQWRAFGNPFSPGHLMVENTALRNAHFEGVYGAVGPSAKALYGLLIDPAAGLFPLTPIALFGVFGFGILILNRSERMDAIIASSLSGLTLLAICSMNNWRGGWTIGPRYLSAVVPFLVWASLPCLEQIAHRSSRLAFSLALGCTVTALIASGLPSVYYPHLPPEFSHPLSQLFALLIAHDFAPYNLGNVLGLTGTQSMWPLGFVAAAALLFCLKSVFGLIERSRLILGSAAVAICLLWPLTSGDSPDPKIRQAVAFITRNWTPEGHDLAAQLQKRLSVSRQNAAELRRRLAEILLREGRDAEARKIENFSGQNPASR